MKRIILAMLITAASFAAIGSQEQPQTKQHTEKMCCFKCCGNQPPVLSPAKH